MKNWKKGILGVALSFMILFVGLGYAGLTDELSILGNLFASEPTEVYITNVAPLEGAPEATISGLRSMTANPSGTVKYAITVKNNTGTTQVCTSVNVKSNNATVTASYLSQTNVEQGVEDPYSVPQGGTFAFSNTKGGDGAYISGIPIPDDGTLTFVVEITPDSGGSEISVEFGYEEVKYSIYYINNGEALDIRCVLNNKEDVLTKNDTAATAAQNQMNSQNDGNKYVFDHWMNAGSTQIDIVDAGNTEDVILYPAFQGVYTAIFVDLDGNILAWDTFTKANYDNIKALGTDTETKVPVVTDCTFDHWEVHVTIDGKTTKTALSAYTFQDGVDISIYPVYVYDGDVTLIPVDNDGDGDTDEYQVSDFSGGQGLDLVEIPNSVNGILVTGIVDKALASYDDIHAVLIPSNVKSIGATAFADGKVTKEYPWGGTYEAEGTETVTLYYQGDYAAWNAISKADGWDNNLGVGSRVFFLGDNGKVDASKGYIELCEKERGKNWLGQETWVTRDTPVWVYHEHSYPNADQVSNGMHSYTTAEGTTKRCEDANGVPYFHFATWTDYDGACDCGCGTRPDAIYWTPTTTASEEETTTTAEETTP